MKGQTPYLHFDRTKGNPLLAKGEKHKEPLQIENLGGEIPQKSLIRSQNARGLDKRPQRAGK